MSERAETFIFAGDGLVPNNPHWALRIYRGVFSGLQGDREQAIIAHVARHGWGSAWINGIYDFQHYHATAFEVLAIAQGSAEVQFGGASGPIMRVAAGDAVVIPPGVGHCRSDATADLSVVGAYPSGQGNYDLKRATPEDHARAVQEIPAVAAPTFDPVTGQAFQRTREHKRTKP